MSTGKSLTPKEQEVVRATVRALVEKHGGQAVVAELLDVRQQTVSQIIRAQTPPGVTVAMRLAKELGVPLEQLLKGQRTGEPVDRYPARAVGLQFARANGISEEAIREVAGWQMHEGEGLTPEDWFEQAKVEQKRQRMKAPPVRPIADGETAGLHNVSEAHRRKKVL